MEPETTRTEKAGERGSLIRRLGPAIPLGIALLHGAFTPQQTGEPAQPTPQVSLTMGARRPPQPPTPGGLACVADGTCKPPFPLVSKGHPVDWFFVFKLNAAKFPKCGAGVDGRTCPFDNGPKGSYSNFGQRYAVATADAPTLVDGTMDCLGTSDDDPVGATFGQVYNGDFHYALWNDQFQGPAMACGQDDCNPPWAHSKGMVAWNDEGEGFVMQVTTPAWPGSGSAKFPRVGNGNTLGCMNKNDVEWSQHFFALRLTEPDLLQVLHGLAAAMVVTGAQGGGKQILSNGGPEEIQVAANALGNPSPQKDSFSGFALIRHSSDLEAASAAGAAMADGLFRAGRRVAADSELVAGESRSGVLHDEDDSDWMLGYDRPGTQDQGWRGGHRGDRKLEQGALFA